MQEHKTDQTENTVRTEAATLDRRTLLANGGLLLGALASTQIAGVQTMFASSAPAPAKAAAEGETFTLAVAGETMVSRPFSKIDDPKFLSLVKQLRDADVAYTHLETNLASADELKWASHGSTGPAGYLVTDPVIAKDLAWAGIDCMSIAQNHSLDWGPDGLLATIKHCNEAGIAVAGTGPDLETARSPTFFESAKGRMSIISIASGNSATEWAGLPKDNVPGRPGVNPIRLLTTYEVPHAEAEQLKAIGKSLHVLSDAAAAKPEFNITPGAVSGSNGFSGFTFAEGDKFAIHTKANPTDVKGNLRSIDEAMKLSDFVMVAQHNSTSEGTRSVTPSDFVVDFAHKAIDAGADIYLGHGWHTFLGIEIYKGKPIMYGLGSFFVESMYMPRVPADQFESYGFDMEALVGLNPASGNLHPTNFDTNWERAALFKLVFTNTNNVKKLTRIELTPIEMGYDYTTDPPKLFRTVGEGPSKYLDGSPRVATGANAQVILQYLQKLNALRGTKMDIRGDLGVIDVPA